MVCDNVSMIQSARRVALTLVIAALFTLGYTTFLTGTPVCSGFGECGAALSLYTLDMSNPAAQSTAPAAVLDPSDDYGFTNQVIQLISLYVLIAGICLLISLEFTKPHYTKPRKSKRRRTA